ncbi:MAG: thioesterase family protein [Hyphomicrobiaceae bacterium]|nr:thioesterase family protein [Hyphomicrobiaceae bacterium]
MNLLFRLIAVILKAIRGAPIAAPFGVSRIAFRVWPHDCDLNFHLNNGRYLTLMDLGRTDLMIRAGLARPALKHGWAPMLSAAEIVFRREIRPFQRFFLESRVLAFSGTDFLMEQRFLITSKFGEEEVAALALVRGGLYDRKGKRFVPVADLFALIGIEASDHPAEGPGAEFLAASTALRAKARTPENWEDTP